MPNSETASATHEFFAGLPCPEPLQTAIKGGLFGIEGDGPVVPDAEDVASITEEHAREMAFLLTDISYLERCRIIGIAPESGRRPRIREARERLANRLVKDVAEMRDKYESCIDVYEQAFGPEGALQLDHCVRASCHAGQAAAPQQQGNLFE